MPNKVPSPKILMSPADTLTVPAFPDPYVEESISPPLLIVRVFLALTWTLPPKPVGTGARTCCELVLRMLPSRSTVIVSAATFTVPALPVDQVDESICPAFSTEREPATMTSMLPALPAFPVSPDNG
ncbi:MAG: hypothetical protein AW06_002983 [Candidatus Accumulibacter cognatus]|uniref:Uncharacterized protein n=1 Tax=Candidatus Accumulibacter cognatus TaxID=2954383 RepID=A0A080M3P9_9PROT|nr:MAG: hypothetical protein AW06_002983 [Candidatus Accumulibacter cognatus]